MKLHCPDCGRLIPAEDVNLATALAKCTACDAVFGFTEFVGQQARQPPTSIAAPSPASPVHGAKPPVPRPPLAPSRKLRLDDFAGTLRVRWRWFSLMYVPLAFFCAAWDSFLIFWYTMAFTMPNAPWIMIVFPVAHLAVGVGLTYSTLAGFLNQTTIELTPTELLVRHGPLPWINNRSLLAGDVASLFCQPAARQKNAAPTLAMELWAVLRAGHRLKLASFTDPEDARYVQRLLEQRMKLPPA